MVRRKVGLGAEGARRGADPGAVAQSSEVLELFFNTGIIYHELALPADLPDVVSSFVMMKDSTGQGWTVRRAAQGEDPDVEVSALDQIGPFSNRWLPVPYQLSCPHCIQLHFVSEGGGVRALLAIDTLEVRGAGGRHLDAALDGARPFRPLDKNEISSFLDHPETRGFIRKLEKAGIDKALFKYAALLETFAPLLPRIRLTRIEEHTPVAVSLVLDFGNSRSTALLCEARDKGLFALPLETRSSSNPFQVSEESVDSRITLLPAAFDPSVHSVCVGDGFAFPSIARLGREALDRALETPHRYACTLSGPKRYLWDGRPTDEAWHFAAKQDGEYKPIFGRILKYLPEHGDGTTLRQDGPSTPPDPRHAPRSMMLLALVELVSQAYAQVNSARYRGFQGREGSPRVIRDIVLTFPSAMHEQEKQVYDLLVRNAVILATHLLNIAPEHRPNWNAADQRFEQFLFSDEALAAQMVFVYQEIEGVFAGKMEDFVSVYGKSGALRVGSVDIGGGTSDVMIAEYSDRQPGTGTCLHIKKLFQDGVSIAGDEVCRALVEEVVFAQILEQLPSHAARTKLIQLFDEGDAGFGASWRTLRAKLVPYFWLPLARCYWAVAEGFEIPDHTAERHYSAADVFRIFENVVSWSPAVLEEVDGFLGKAIEDFPGLHNLFFRFDRREIERTIEGVLREPLRRYSDILAQFDVDLLVLAGRTSALKCVRNLFVSEMPVPVPRIKSMSSYRVGEWFPSKWQDGEGRIKDPKSTVAAGATVLHLASKNKLPGFVLDRIEEAPTSVIYGLYQDAEPHIARDNELFREGKESKPFAYTAKMVIGVRHVDSQEMDGSPLYEVTPADRDVEGALLEDRVSLRFALGKQGEITISSVESQKDRYTFTPEDFELRLKTVREDRYWLDTGVFRTTARYS